MYRHEFDAEAKRLSVITGKPWDEVEANLRSLWLNEVYKLIARLNVDQCRQVIDSLIATQKERKLPTPGTVVAEMQRRYPIITNSTKYEPMSQEEHIGRSLVMIREMSPCHARYVIEQEVEKRRVKFEPEVLSALVLRAGDEEDSTEPRAESPTVAARPDVSDRVDAQRRAAGEKED
jgi:hypothetical protein